MRVYDAREGVGLLLRVVSVSHYDCSSIARCMVVAKEEGSRRENRGQAEPGCESKCDAIMAESSEGRDIGAVPEIDMIQNVMVTEEAQQKTAEQNEMDGGLSDSRSDSLLSKRMYR